MAYALENLTAIAKHAIGGDFSTAFDPVDVVNHAGRHMVNATPWNWRSRAPVGLSFVASQDYVSLPSDFGELLGIVPSNGQSNSFILTTLDDVRFRRSDNFADTSAVRYGALEYPDQTTESVNAGVARLAVHPTPAGSESNALYLTYRAGWVELDENGDLPNIPLGFEALLVRYIRAFAREYENDEVGLVDAVDSSGLRTQLLRHDAAAQANLGQVQGGILQVVGGEDDRRYFTTVQPS